MIGCGLWSRDRRFHLKGRGLRPCGKKVVRQRKEGYELRTVTKVELIQRLNRLQEELEQLRKEVEIGKIIEDSEESMLFWESFGSWEDDRTAEEIIKDIYESRSSTSRNIRL